MNKSIEIIEVVVAPFAGVNIGEAIKESIILALTEDRKVNLVFNDKWHIISPQEIIGSIKPVGSIVKEEGE